MNKICGCHGAFLVQDSWDFWGIRWVIRFLGSRSASVAQIQSAKGELFVKNIETSVFRMTDIYGIKPPTCSREKM